MARKSTTKSALAHWRLGHLGVSQEKLAEMLGYGREYIAKLEISGELPPRFRSKLAQIYGVETLEYLAILERTLESSSREPLPLPEQSSSSNQPLPLGVNITSTGTHASTASNLPSLIDGIKALFGDDNLETVELSLKFKMKRGEEAIDWNRRMLAWIARNFEAFIDHPDGTFTVFPGPDKVGGFTIRLTGTEPFLSGTANRATDS